VAQGVTVQGQITDIGAKVLSHEPHLSSRPTGTPALFNCLRKYRRLLALDIMVLICVVQD